MSTAGPRTVVSIPLAGGVSEHIDDRVAPPPYVHKSLHTRLTKEGRVFKRPGFAAMNASNLPADTFGMNRCFQLDGVPFVWGEQGAWQFSDTANAWYEVFGQAKPVGYERVGTVTAQESIRDYDLCNTGSYKIEIWRVEEVVHWRVLDANTGAVLVPARRLVVGINWCQLVEYDGVPILLTKTTGNVLAWRTYDVASGNWSVPTTIASGVVYADADYIALGNTCYFAYTDSLGAVTVGILTDTGVSSSPMPKTATMASVNGPIRVSAQSVGVVLAGVDIAFGANGVKLRGEVFDTGLATVRLQDVLVQRDSADGSGTPATDFSRSASVVCGVTSGGAYFFGMSFFNVLFKRAKRFYRPYSYWSVHDDAVGLPLLSEGVTTPNMWFTGRCIRPENKNLVMVAEAAEAFELNNNLAPDPDTIGVSSYNPRFPAAYVLELDETTVGVDEETAYTSTPAAYLHPLARFNHDTAASARNCSNGYSPHWTFDVIELVPKYLFPGLAATSSVVNNYPVRDRTTRWRRGETRSPFYPEIEILTDGVLAKFDWFPPLRTKAQGEGSVLLNQGTYLAVCDGSQVFENAPLWAPQLDPQPQYTAAAVTTNPTNRSFRAVLVVKDASGVLHRSVPSEPLVLETAPVGGGGYDSGTPQQFSALSLVVNFPRITCLRPNNGLQYYIQVYATDNGNLQDGPYGLITETPLVYDTDYGVHTVEIDVDELQIRRLTLTGSPQLYTESGILENEPTPPFRDFTAGTDRFFGINEEDRSQIYESKLPELRTTCEWNGALAFGTNTNLQFVALGRLDEKVIYFTKDEIFASLPSTRDNRGSGGSPVLSPVSSDTGCTNPLSIVNTNSGMLFEGERGIYMLGRGMDVQYVGAPVEDTLKASSIVDAILSPEFHEALFFLASGEVLVYHTLRNSWTTTRGEVRSVFRIGETLYYAVQSTGWACLEERDPTDTIQSTVVRYDGSIFPNAMEVATTWLKLTGMQGFKRVKRIRLLGEMFSTLASSLRINVYYDYDDSTVVDSWTINLSPGRFQLQFIPSKQKCESIKVEIVELAGYLDNPNYSTIGFEVSDLTLEIQQTPPRGFQHIGADSKR